MKYNSIFKWLSIVLGSLTFSLSVACIASPAGLVTGGVSGIAIILKTLTAGKIPLALTTIVLNAPLYIICAIQKGRDFFFRSLAVLLLNSTALTAFEALPPLVLGGDLLAVSVLYGVLSGAGLGLILKSGASSGGGDMLALLLKKRYPHLSMASLILIIDAVVVTVGALVFGVRISLYAVLALTIASKVIDIILSGVKTSKVALIVTKSASLSQILLQELSRGVSIIDATGAYSGESRKMLFVVLTSRQLPTLQRILVSEDSEAFVTIMDASKVFGKGFSSHIA